MQFVSLPRRARAAKSNETTQQVCRSLCFYESVTQGFERNVIAYSDRRPKELLYREAVSASGGSSGAVPFEWIILATLPEPRSALVKRSDRHEARKGRQNLDEIPLRLFHRRLVNLADYPLICVGRCGRIVCVGAATFASLRFPSELLPSPQGIPSN
jgi:hypothetical protein